jgi:hypothetical protein
MKKYRREHIYFLKLNKYKGWLLIHHPFQLGSQNAVILPDSAILFWLNSSAEKMHAKFEKPINAISNLLLS